ncbi:hypothetical protein Ahia01_001383400, partial [Argonauta hians]
MNASERKKLEKLQKEKKDAERRKKSLQVAELCSAIGDMYRRHGLYEQAIAEYSEDLSICETNNDQLGAAVACRLLSECHCDLGDTSKAIQLQKRYLSLARSLNNSVEEQRAWATIGRTYLFEAEADSDRKQSVYVKAEEAFVHALELCENMKGELNHKEYITMKARLFLNIGVVHNGRHNTQEFKNYMERCIALSRANGLDEELFRCHSQLADHYNTIGRPSLALGHVDAALKCATKVKDKQMLTDSHMLKFQVCFELCQYVNGRHSLKKLLQLGAYDQPLQHRKVKKFYKIAQKCETIHETLKRLRSLPGPQSTRDQMKQFECLADYSVDLSFYKLAIRYYHKVLELGAVVRTPASELAPIFVSLAQTYQDDLQYEKAVEFYQRELHTIDDGLPEQSCETLLNIAINQENLKLDYDVVKLSYLKALNVADETGNLQLQSRVLKLLLQAQATYNEDKDRKKYLEKFKQLKSKLTGLSGASGGRGDIADSGGSDDGDNHDDEDDEDDD